MNLGKKCRGHILLEKERKANAKICMEETPKLLSAKYIVILNFLNSA